jgi:hypothetical protein
MAITAIDREALAVSSAVKARYMVDVPKLIPGNTAISTLFWVNSGILNASGMYGLKVGLLIKGRFYQVRRVSKMPFHFNQTVCSIQTFSMAAAAM